MPAHTTSETLIWQGKEFRIKSLSWGQEFSAGLPDVVAAASGFSTWGGSCELLPNYDSFSGGVNPWSDAHPRPGDRVTIRVFFDGQLVAEYNPVIDEISFTPDRAKVDFIQPTDTFSRLLRLPPVMQTAPRTTAPDDENGGTYDIRYPAPTVMWTVAEAFRLAGYHLTPPVHPSTVIDVSMQGAIWANQWKQLGETVLVESEEGSPVAFPRIYGGEGILWMHHGRIYVMRSDKRDLSSGFRCSFLVHPRSSAKVEVMAMAGAEYVVVIVDAQRNLWLRRSGDDTSLGLIRASEWEGRQEVCLIYQPGTVTLEAGDAKVTASVTLESQFSGVRAIAGENAGIAGLQVDSLAYGATNRIKGFTPTARIKGGLFTSYMRVCLPSVRDEPARKVLDDICSATLASWWVDGDGIANFEDANSFTGAAPAHTLEAVDIGDYNISSDLQNAGSSVVVRYSEASRSASNRHAINLWVKGGTATAGTESQDFASPSDEVEWIDPDFTFNRIASDVPGFNSRNGSWWGGSKNGATADAPTVWASGYRFSTRPITPWVLLIAESFAEDTSRAVYESPDIWRGLRNLDTPILRGRGLVTRQDNIISLDGGRDFAPVVEIDARKWVDREDRAQEIAAYLMRFLASPPPLLKDVDVAYQPTIRLGKAVRINGYSADGTAFLFGALLTCTVVGFKHSPDAGTTTLSLRVITVEATAKTWREVEAAATRAGITWEQAEKSITDRGVTWSLFGNSEEDYGG